MRVKLKDSINIDDFLKITFGATFDEYYIYYVFFNINDLKKPLHAELRDDILYVDIICIWDSKTQSTCFVNIPYRTNEDKNIWEIIN